MYWALALNLERWRCGGIRSCDRRFGVSYPEGIMHSPVALRLTRWERAINPSELMCKWFGHEIKDLTVRTPNRRTVTGDLQFFVSQTCQRCGATREDQVIGNQPYHIDSARLQESFNLFRELKTQERSRR